MFAKQNGVCAICGNPPKKTRLAVDHNHTTGKNRGLLCGSCNGVLGYLDNPVWLEKALIYRDHLDSTTQNVVDFRHD